MTAADEQRLLDTLGAGKSEAVFPSFQALAAVLSL